MNLEVVTIEDCIENYERNGKAVVINDGKVIGFKKEIPTQTANPSGDK